MQTARHIFDAALSFAVIVGACGLVYTHRQLTAQARPVVVVERAPPHLIRTWGPGPVVTGVEECNIQPLTTLVYCVKLPPVLKPITWDDEAPKQQQKKPAAKKAESRLPPPPRARRDQRWRD